MGDEILIDVEFTGGLELLFSNQKKHTVKLPKFTSAGQRANMSSLIDLLCRELVDGNRKDMFVVNESVPGVLVLINDADWELEGGDQYELNPNDNVLFVSTLHGG